MMTTFSLTGIHTNYLDVVKKFDFFLKENRSAFLGLSIGSRPEEPEHLTKK